MFIEEPTWRETPQALGDLAAKSPVALAGGEGLVSRYEFKQLLDAKGAQILQPEVIHCGGITEIRKIAALAEPYGVEIAPHMYYGPVAHVASLHAMALRPQLPHAGMGRRHGIPLHGPHPRHVPRSSTRAT